MPFETAYRIDDSARVVADMLLDITERAVMAGDFDAYADCFHLPHPIETVDDSRVIRNLADLRETFDDVRNHLVKNGVTKMNRELLRAVPIDDDTIETTHKSRLVCGTHLIHSPYEVHSMVRRIDGVWRIVSGAYVIRSSPELIAALRGA